MAVVVLRSPKHGSARPLIISFLVLVFMSTDPAARSVPATESPAAPPAPATGPAASPPAGNSPAAPPFKRGPLPVRPREDVGAEALRKARSVSASAVAQVAQPTGERAAAESAAPAGNAAAPAAATAESVPATGAPIAPQPQGGQRSARQDKPRGDKPRRPRGEAGKPDDGTFDEPRGERDRGAPSVPVPSRRGPLSADLQAEIDAALGGFSVEEIASGKTTNAPTADRLENESRHRAQVTGLHGDNVFFALGGKNQGVTSIRNFQTPPQVGEVIEVVVTGFNTEDNLHEVAVPGGTIVVGDWGDIAEGSLVEARITAANTGGLECAVNKLRGFIPASQIGLYRVENLSDFVDQKMICVVMSANQQRGNLMLSRRAVLEREKEESKKQLMAEIAPGQVRDGVVRRIQDFGAFVDIGGVDGLIHISQLSWERVKHPSEILAEGQKIRVRIEKIDAATGKIALSLKNPEEHPWTNVDQKFPVGTTVRGPVTRLAQFGAFVKLAPGVEGLIHISELAHHRVYKVEHVVQEGQEVECKILSIDPDAQRIGLSLKATLAQPVKNEKPKEGAEVEEPPRASAVPKRGGPLRGGAGKASGGDKFGLNW